MTARWRFRRNFAANVGRVLSIVGPGGVGGVLAAVAKERGVEVEVVARARTAEIINEHGLNLKSSLFGDISVPMSAKLAPTPGSSVIIAVKSYTLPAVADSIAESAPAEIIALCNGLSHVDQVHSLGADRVTCGSIRIVSERSGPGKYRHYSSFADISVEESAADWEAVRLLAQAGITTRVGGSEMEVLWRKLRSLAPMALLTASKRQPLGEALIGSEPLIAEIAAIATASGLASDPEEVLAGLKSIEPESSSSLARDVEAGNPTELDALGYDLLRRAERLGIATPALITAIERIEEYIAS